MLLLLFFFAAKKKIGNGRFADWDANCVHFECVAAQLTILFNSLEYLFLTCKKKNEGSSQIDF